MTDKIEKILLVLLFLVFVSLDAAYLNVFNSLKVPCCADYDWSNFHYPNIQRLLSGNAAPLFAYPPFFTLSMSLVAWMPTQVLEILISSALFGSILFFTYRIKGAIISSIVGLMLISSSVFLSYSLSLAPTVIDIILFLLVSLFLYEKKPAPASVVMIFLMYNHALNIFWFLIVLAYSLIYRKEYLKYLGIIFILSLPVLYAFTLPNIVGTSIFSQGFISYSYSDPFLKSLMSPLQQLLSFSGIALWLMLPVTIYSMYRFRKFSEIDAFCFFWMLSFIIFAELDPRWLFLFVIPFSIFEGLMISKLIEPRRF